MKPPRPTVFKKNSFSASGAAEKVPGLSALGECFFHGSVDGQELVESCYLDHRAALLRQSREREGLPLVSPVNKELHQRSHTRGVEKRHAAQIENEMSCRLRPHSLNEIVDCLEAEFAVEPHHHPIAVGTYLLFHLQVSWLHAPRRVAQNLPAEHYNSLTMQLTLTVK